MYMELSALKELGLTNREIEIYLKLLEQGETSATEVAIMIRRIDDLIAGSSRGADPSMPPGGMPPGMGGMPGM